MILRSRKTRIATGPAPSGAATSVVTDRGENADGLSRKLVALWSEQSQETDPVLRAASLILTHHIQLGRRGLVVGGPEPGVGASFMAANLAAALAQTGVSTLLIDANLRRPSLDQYFRPDQAGLGLQQFLRSPEIEVAEIVEPEVLPNLAVVYSGGVAADCQELLTSERFRTFLLARMREYDCTLIDTSAGNRSADACVIGSIVGHVLIVARKGVSFVDDVEIFSDELTEAGAAIFGTILNGA